jgi:hypothetical protein
MADLVLPAAEAPVVATATPAAPAEAWDDRPPAE